MLSNTRLRAEVCFSKIFAEGDASFGHRSRHIVTDSRVQEERKGGDDANHH